MKTEFKDIIPRLVQNMDGSKIIPSNVHWIDTHESNFDDLKRHVSAGDAIDFALFTAMHQATNQGEDLREVARHIRYITDQLAILRRNLEAEVDALEFSAARDNHHAKTA